MWVCDYIVLVSSSRATAIAVASKLYVEVAGQVLAFSQHYLETMFMHKLFSL